MNVGFFLNCMLVVCNSFKRCFWTHRWDCSVLRAKWHENHDIIGNAGRQLPTSSTQLVRILWLNPLHSQCCHPQRFYLQSLRNTWELFKCGSIRPQKRRKKHSQSANCRIWQQRHWSLYQIPSKLVFWITKHVYLFFFFWFGMSLYQ